MIPHYGRVKHDPPHSYGDCVRACVASIFDADDIEAVPHFFEDGCDPDTAFARLRSWAEDRGFVPFVAHYGADVSFEALRVHVGRQSSKLTYIVMGGGHAVVCRGHRVVHDPGWVPTTLKTDDVWNVLVFVKL